MGGLTSTTYDADSEPLTVTDPLLRVTTMTYNPRGWTRHGDEPAGVHHDLFL